MKPEPAACFLAAVLVHALVLFGFRMETPARPLALSAEPSPVEVSLVKAPPAPPAPPAPVAPPEPAATPAPPEPQPTPEQMPTPDSTPVPEQENMPPPESTPAPAHHHRAQRHPSTPQSAAGAADALAGPHGAPSGPLSSRASYLSNPKPDYPDAARRQRQQGVVIVSVEVGADGRPEDVTLARTSGFSLLDQAALEAVRRWRFDPARSAGLPVSSRAEVPVRFSLSQ